MKTRWISIAGALMIISAGRAWTDDATAAQVLADDELVERNGCMECHAVSDTAFAPSFPQIAERYADDPGARDALIETTKQGGKGNWIEISFWVPMPPYSPRLSDDTIERMVDWILGL